MAFTPICRSTVYLTALKEEFDCIQSKIAVVENNTQAVKDARNDIIILKNNLKDFDGKFASIQEKVKTVTIIEANLEANKRAFSDQIEELTGMLIHEQNVRRVKILESTNKSKCMLRHLKAFFDKRYSLLEEKISKDQDNCVCSILLYSTEIKDLKHKLESFSEQNSNLKQLINSDCLTQKDMLRTEFYDFMNKQCNDIEDRQKQREKFLQKCYSDLEKELCSVKDYIKNSIDHLVIINGCQKLCLRRDCCLEQETELCLKNIKNCLKFSVCDLNNQGDNLNNQGGNLNNQNNEEKAKEDETFEKTVKELEEKISENSKEINNLKDNIKEIQDFSEQMSELEQKIEDLEKNEEGKNELIDSINNRCDNITDEQQKSEESLKRGYTLLEEKMTKDQEILKSELSLFLEETKNLKNSQKSITEWKSDFENRFKDYLVKNEEVKKEMVDSMNNVNDNLKNEQKRIEESLKKNCALFEEKLTMDQEILKSLYTSSEDIKSLKDDQKSISELNFNFEQFKTDIAKNEEALKSKLLDSVNNHYDKMIAEKTEISLKKCYVQFEEKLLKEKEHLQNQLSASLVEIKTLKDSQKLISELNPNFEKRLKSDFAKNEELLKKELQIFISDACKKIEDQQRKENKTVQEKISEHETQVSSFYSALDKKVSSYSTELKNFEKEVNSLAEKNSNFEQRIEDDLKSLEERDFDLKKFSTNQEKSFKNRFDDFEEKLNLFDGKLKSHEKRIRSQNFWCTMFVIFIILFLSYEIVYRQKVLHSNFICENLIPSEYLRILENIWEYLMNLFSR